jgi:UDP-3-O-[3-hydroxymyristoyl] glucosamine N-acyltransferase
MTIRDLIRRVPAPAAIAIGDDQARICSVASPAEGDEGSIVFVEGDPAWAVQRIRSSRASVLVIAGEVPDGDKRSFIRTNDPRAWFIAALRIMFPTQAEVRISRDARVSERATLGRNVSVGEFSVIGHDVVIGDDTRIGSHVVIHDRTVIGARCILQDHSAVGSTGMAYHRGQDNALHFFPHMGRVRIGDDVEIAVGCCIVRGMMNDTVIGSGTKIGNYVNVGHNSVIGEKCWISSQSLLCGRVELEGDVRLAASVTISDHVVIGRGATVGLGSVVTKSIAPGSKVFGVPARPLATMKGF